MVNSNAEFYVEQQKLPFVLIGTTGGDREKLVDRSVNKAKHFAVIAPNMANQIVAMQSALEDLAKKFPRGRPLRAIPRLEQNLTKRPRRILLGLPRQWLTHSGS